MTTIPNDADLLSEIIKDCQKIEKVEARGHSSAVSFTRDQKVAMMIRTLAEIMLIRVTNPVRSITVPPMSYVFKDVKMNLVHEHGSVYRCEFPEALKKSAIDNEKERIANMARVANGTMSPMRYVDGKVQRCVNGKWITVGSYIEGELKDVDGGLALHDYFNQPDPDALPRHIEGRAHLVGPRAVNMDDLSQAAQGHVNRAKAVGAVVMSYNSMGTVMVEMTLEHAESLRDRLPMLPPGDKIEMAPAIPKTAPVFDGWAWFMDDMWDAMRMGWCLTAMDDGQIIIGGSDDAEPGRNYDTWVRGLAANSFFPDIFSDAEFALMRRAVMIADMSKRMVIGERTLAALADADDTVASYLSLTTDTDAPYREAVDAAGVLRPIVEDQ